MVLERADWARKYPAQECAVTFSNEESGRGPTCAGNSRWGRRSCRIRQRPQAYAPPRITDVLTEKPFLSTDGGDTLTIVGDNLGRC